MDEGDAMAQIESFTGERSHAMDHQEIDYDVADDNEWAQ